LLSTDGLKEQTVSYLTSPTSGGVVAVVVMAPEKLSDAFSLASLLSQSGMAGLSKRGWCGKLSLKCILAVLDIKNLIEFYNLI
jgi:hypothetical protein